MAKIRLDLSQFKASGIYTIEYDASESIIINTQTTRLVVGFSKKGPINAPVYCDDVKTARTIFGDIDKDLENKGSFFHRSLFTCLEVGPCFALNLVPLNNDEDTSNVDKDTYKSFSLSSVEENGSSESVLYSSFFNKERFYFPDTSYFLSNVNGSTSPNQGKLFNFVNLGQTPFSIIVKKTGSLSGFNVTARDWYGAGNVPDFLHEFDYISDYFVDVDIISGDWTDFSTLSVDTTFSKYFDSKGIMKDKYDDFLNADEVTRIGSFQGCIIPDLVDSNNVNYSIDTIINAQFSTTGLFCALDRDAINAYVVGESVDSGNVDMVGHGLIQSDAPSSVNFLSYNFPVSEYFDYSPLLSTHSTTNNNTLVWDLGASSGDEIPGGVGYTGATYDSSVNGYDSNLPTQVAYMTSYYGSGNNGKFNNVLVFRKEAFSSAQYEKLSNLTVGTSLILNGATGATQYASISSLNEEIISEYISGATVSRTRLKIGISHPNKQSEGTTTGKNARVVSVSSPSIVVGGTAAASEINAGDWIYGESSSTRYYFRVDSVGTTGSNTTITVDTYSTEFSGSTYIGNINTSFKIYWESGTGVGSLFDVISSSYPTLTEVVTPDIFNYVTVLGGQSYYIGYEGSDMYKAFKSGLLSDGDIVYASTKLYLDSTFALDSDSVKTVVLKSYYDDSLAVGFTGSWALTDIKDSSGNLVNALRIYSSVGDFKLAISATGFNTTRTSCYVSTSDQSNISVGQYIVADPLNTGDPVDFILTRVISKKKISSGDYSGYYQINTIQRMASTVANGVDYSTNIVRYKTIEDFAPGYQPTYLSGFKMTSYHLPDGSTSQLTKILGMLDPANSNLRESLISRHIISFRYVIDTFSGGLNAYSAPKNYLTILAKKRQKCMAIMNAPSMAQFIASTDPRFTELPSSTDPKPILKTEYIADGGNLSLGPSFVYSLPDEENGSKFCGFFAPFLTIRENNKNFNIPPAADVSNNFIRKFINGQPYSIVAGPRRGVLSNPKLVGLEYDFSDSDREYLEPMGINPIVYRKGTGYMIYANQSAYQKTNSAFNNLHVRDLLITIEEAIEDVLADFMFEFNDASTRLQIKTIVDSYLDGVKTSGGIYDFSTVMNKSNNTDAIIDQNVAIIDVGVEPAKGCQKFINRITVLKTGGISSGGFTVA